MLTPPGQVGLAAGSSSQERPPLSIVVNSLLFSDEGADDKGHIMVKTLWRSYWVYQMGIEG